MIVKFVKYNIVQVIAYGVELSVFFSVLYVFPGYLLSSNVAAKLSAGLFAFVCHKYFTFRSLESNRIKGEAFRYILVLAGNTVLGSVLLLVFASMFSEAIAKISADVVAVGVTFLLTHTLVFNYKNTSDDGRV